MNEAVYEAGLGRLLDGEMTPAEGEEFAAHLRDRPELVRDLQQHLALWEVWSQRQSSERSSAAFAAAWETRLSAEGTAEAFCRAIEARVAAPDRAMNLWARAWRALRSFRPAEHRWATLASAAAMLGVCVIYFWIGATPIVAGPVVTIEGEAVCTRCILHETHECHAAIRVGSGGAARIYYVNATKEVARNCPAHYCTPRQDRVRATGTTRVEQGRLQLEATDLVLNP